MSSVEYLESQASKDPAGASVYQELSQLQQKKLYHQMTSVLLSLLTNPHFQSNSRLLSLHDNFVAPKLVSKLNPLAYVQFAIAASEQAESDEAALKVLEEKVAESVKEEPQARLLAQVAAYRKKIKIGQAEQVKDKIEEAKNALESYSGVMDAQVYSAYYKTAAEFHKQKGTPAQHFSNALLYLTYTPLDSLSAQEQQTLAAEVGMSALLGENVYNFGELLQHPVLKALEGTEYAWLGPLLHAFNAGQIEAFNKSYNDIKAKQPLLSSQIDFLNQKIRIMALLEMVFRRGVSESKLITFQEIAKQCQTPVDQVEWLLMKALALKVIRGSIDQVNGSVRISWVTPRVLNSDQLTAVRDRVKHWQGQVQEAVGFVQNNGAGIVQAAYA